MKKITKIKLINWHTFYNQTFAIKNNTLLTGINGSGKSTLLDAIQYVLTGGKAKFNQAAGDVTKRTLESYVRGKLSLSNKEYLRAQDVTSYIALEFYDDLAKKYDVIGAIIQIPSTSNLTRGFFRIAKCQLTDSLFIEDNIPISMNRFKRKENVEYFDTTSEISKMLSSFLGIPHQKYSELLTKALAFKPISNINDFVNTFLLSEDNISLENLQQNIEQFRNLQELIANEEAKIAELEKLEDLNNNYLKTEEDISKNNYFLKKLSLTKITKELEEISFKLNKNTNEENLLKEKLENINNDISNLNVMISKYETRLLEHEEYRLLEDWKEKEKETTETVKALKKDLNNLNDYIKMAQKNLKDYSWSSKLTKLDVYTTDFTQIKDTITDIYHQATIAKNDIDEKLYNTNTNLKKLKLKLTEIENNLSLLKAKKFPFPNSGITLLQTEIASYLKDKYKKDIEIRPLCEYLEITDEKWRNAIEGYLNTQKFDLIIEPKYFDEALNIYESIKKDKKISGVGLVNIAKIREKVSKNDNSNDNLSNYVTSSNIYAKDYAFYLLNRVTCCLDVNDLKKYENAITPTCMTYRNHTARQINPEAYKYYYIGEDALNQQIKMYEADKATTSKSYNESVERYNKLDLSQNNLKNIDFDYIFKSLPQIQKYIDSTNELETIKKRRESLNVDNLFTNVIEEKKKLEEEKSLKTKAFNEVNESLISIRATNQTLSNDMKNLQLEHDEYKDSLKSYTDYEEDFKNLLANKDITKLEKSLKEDSNFLNNSYIELKTKIENFQEGYNSKYQLDEITSIDNVDYYLQELYRMREKDLKKYKSKSIEFEEQCQKSFHEDFISKLKNKIYYAEEELKNLNKALKNSYFGKDKYEFIYTSSNDPELAKYYKIITSGKDYQINTLFEEHLSLEEQDTMDELFEKITSSTSLDTMNKVVSEYTDYRRYMSYDIKITNENDETYYFSKVSKEKSGGEIQTPFYVIIAASFEQLLRSSKKDSSVGCFVMFDEAFNNMDESRIEAMMNFYNSLNIQLMIAVPPNRIATIIPYVNTNLLIFKDNNISYAKTVTLDEIAFNEE